MFSFFKKLFTSDKKRFSDQEKILAKGTPEDKKLLAESAETHPEILYYLTQDADPDIRRAVAQNKATPLKASEPITKDKDVDVRLALAGRLMTLLPGLSEEKQGQIYAYAVNALGILAEDEVLKIRQALSATLKDYAKTPPKIASQLARDVERAVSEPILRFCVALPDEDLLDILGNYPEPWIISAIAGRPVVSEIVSDKVIDTGDRDAGGILLDNSGARLSLVTLQKIIEKSKEYPEWQGKVAVRKEISLDLAHHLAGFVSESVLKVLEDRSDFDPATRKTIVDIVKRRLEYHRHGAPHEAPESKVERFFKNGKLSDSIIQDALVWQETDFVILALSVLSSIHPIIVKKMLNAGSAKPIVALCWKAKMPMSLAVALQRDVAKLQPKEFLYARGGKDYPLTSDEVKWQLEFFGVS